MYMYNRALPAHFADLWLKQDWEIIPEMHILHKKVFKPDIANFSEKH